MATKPKNPRKTFFRTYLYEMREKINKSQAQVAEEAGFDHSTYNQIECGKQGFNMNAHRLILLSRALCVPLEKLVRAEAKYYEAWMKINNKQYAAMGN